MRLIYADNLYRRVKTECNPYGKPTIEYESGCKVLDWIESAPTIDAEPVRHGHWTWFYTSKQELSNGSTEYTPMFMCSECGHHYESYRRYDEPHEEDADYPEYCENCGARMDGKEQTNEENV